MRTVSLDIDLLHYILNKCDVFVVRDVFTVVEVKFQNYLHVTIVDRIAHSNQFSSPTTYDDTNNFPSPNLTSLHSSKDVCTVVDMSVRLLTFTGVTQQVSAPVRGYVDFSLQRNICGGIGTRSREARDGRTCESNQQRNWAIGYQSARRLTGNCSMRSLATSRRRV